VATVYVYRQMNMEKEVGLCTAAYFTYKVYQTDANTVSWLSAVQKLWVFEIQVFYT
jgi:hypothetical protein